MVLLGILDLRQDKNTIWQPSNNTLVECISDCIATPWQPLTAILHLHKLDSNLMYLHWNNLLLITEISLPVTQLSYMTNISLARNSLEVIRLNDNLLLSWLWQGCRYKTDNPSPFYEAFPLCCSGLV